jgi:hypothetical protein
MHNGSVVVVVIMLVGVFVSMAMIVGMFMAMLMGEFAPFRVKMNVSSGLQIAQRDARSLRASTVSAHINQALLT